MKKVIMIILSLSMLLMSCSMFESQEHKDAIMLDRVCVASSQEVTGAVNEVMNTLNEELNRAYNMHTRIDTAEINQKIREGIAQAEMASLLLSAANEVDAKINYKQSSKDFYDGCKDLLTNDFSVLVKEIQDKDIANDEMVIIGNRLIVTWGKMLKMQEQIKNVEHAFAAKYDIEKSGDPWDLEKQKKAYRKAKADFDKAKKESGIE